MEVISKLGLKGYQKLFLFKINSGLTINSSVYNQTCEHLPKITLASISM